MGSRANGRLDIDELELIIGSLYMAEQQTENDYKLISGQIHLIGFFLQEKYKKNIGLKFIDSFGPYSPTLQNHLNYAVMFGLINETKKESNPSKITEYLYSLTSEGRQYYEVEAKKSVMPIEIHLKEILKDIIAKTYYELLRVAYSIWEENSREEFAKYGIGA